MREIKFRAWDKEHEKMTVCMALEKMLEKCPDPFYRMFKDDYEWMQFTGLHDKNRKEIYEGDIVKAKDEMAEVKFEGVVEWFGHLGYFALIIIGDPDEGHLRFSDVVRPELEVLGNKFENPELLGGVS